MGRRAFIALLIASVSLVRAQSPFEVVSIKPSKAPGPTMSMPANQISITGMTLENLILLAYKVPLEDIVGMPKWAKSSRYDIQAKFAAGQTPRLDMSLMQPVLAERFKLKVRREKRERQVYALVVSKKGLRIKKADDAPAGLIVPMSMFASTLSRTSDRRIVDQTGLTGNYVFQLRWTDDDGTPRALGFPRTDNPPASPSLLTALREELGLELQPKRLPLDTLVVESVSPPTEN